MIREVTQIIVRDLNIARYSGGSWSQGAIFFVLFTLLAAFALGPEQAARANMAPALIWLAATLSSQLALGHMFTGDLGNGMLDCWKTSNRHISSFVIGKFITHWALVFGPILLMAPLGALMLGAPVSTLAPLLVSLLIGGPALILFGGMAAALTANTKGNGLLVVLLSGPLLASPLIFGVGAVQAELINTIDLKILGAISLAASVLCPIISIAALKVHLE
ncbi:MAG: hypothetical protein COA47_04005 [Robiginitomaculum sp.]|nr:MAG: hypothetical protein COA47_04005 [Robiginitomaculum sp.]